MKPSAFLTSAVAALAMAGGGVLAQPVHLILQS